MPILGDSIGLAILPSVAGFGTPDPEAEEVGDWPTSTVPACGEPLEGLIVAIAPAPPLYCGCCGGDIGIVTDVAVVVPPTGICVIGVRLTHVSPAPRRCQPKGICGSVQSVVLIPMHCCGSFGLIT